MVSLFTHSNDRSCIHERLKDKVVSSIEVRNKLKAGRYEDSYRRRCLRLKLTISDEWIFEALHQGVNSYVNFSSCFWVDT